MTSKPFGPFSVAPGQISALGKDFTSFANELLRIESSAANLDGEQLTIEAFAAQLPSPTPEQTLEALANTRRWDLPDGELQLLPFLPRPGCRAC